MKKSKIRDKESLAILQDSETRYRRLFETAQDGILLLDAETGAITDVNPFLEDMLGYSRAEFLGKKLWDIGPFKDIPNSQSAFLELQTKKYIRYEDLPLETKDGRSVNVEFVSNVYAVGRDTVIQCNIRDITERRVAEEQLKYSERKLLTILEAIPSTILILNEQLIVKTANGASMQTFGIPATSIINRVWCEALGCIHIDGVLESCSFFESCNNCSIKDMVQLTMSSKKTQHTRTNFEFLLDGKTHKRFLSINAAPIVFEMNQMALLTVEDITELSYLRQRLKIQHSFAGIVGRDKKMLELYDTIKDLADVNASVLIQGESGTGKELVASAIHNEGPRRNKQFVPVNCGALPDGLLESELFGHCKGSFTGAIRDKKGRFEIANGGTIFLDEVGDLSPAMQVKLLRVLQDGSFEPVGSEKTMKVDVRTICATNKDLKKEMKDGRFREDLFYRLCVVPITIPPLKERLNDIPLLVENFLEWFAKEPQNQKASLSPGVLDLLMGYHWPGNVRELQNALQFALVKCHNNIIKPEHLPVGIFQTKQRPPRRRRRTRKLDSSAVEDALQKTHGNKVEAARLLGVSRATLYRFLSEK